jgi:hypothetical protein
MSRTFLWVRHFAKEGSRLQQRFVVEGFDMNGDVTQGCACPVLEVELRELSDGPQQYRLIAGRGAEFVGHVDVESSSTPLRFVRQFRDGVGVGSMVFKIIKFRDSA